MVKLARTTDLSKTEIAEYPITHREAFALFPPNTSPVDHATAATFEAVPVVLVEETARPDLAFGEQATVIPVLVDGIWHEEWSVVPASTPQVRAQLRDMARDLLTQRVEALHAAEVELFSEVGRLELLGGTPDQAKFPFIQAYQTLRGLTFAAAAAEAAALRNAWKTAAAPKVARYVDVIRRIQAASTAAEAKAIYDELEAMS